ncbi:hypothetical protein BOS5A_170118 [Bosea sp. EC-HK365B]|nr:hypothetical protein BOSE21B_111033 [Bosea sp. 21B]CAD5274272.1 hypothetical protein BOSE7B_40118 [Bosea sp. 7B]VVT56763.1 hypothetical protein BOS5A_170118 [Bosea sp. EC-HK365B]VXB75839.1 hypothetical protein BOSE29B_120162 [Bosea sp. 29B]VXC14010.1 hypothetical protein BOSE125_180014 [Bosea sp. 125]VXC74371.1 hypothetical protein BOSE127_40359 [Bosea sp. 127]
MNHWSQLLGRTQIECALQKTPGLSRAHLAFAELFLQSRQHYASVFI